MNKFVKTVVAATVILTAGQMVCQAAQNVADMNYLSAKESHPVVDPSYNIKLYRVEMDGDVLKQVQVEFFPGQSFSEGAKVELWEGTKLKKIAESTLTKHPTANGLIGLADFDNLLDKGKDYTVFVPAGTVYDLEYPEFKNVAEYLPLPEYTAPSLEYTSWNAEIRDNKLYKVSFHFPVSDDVRVAENGAVQCYMDNVAGESSFYPVATAPLTVERVGNEDVVSADFNGLPIPESEYSPALATLVVYSGTLYNSTNSDLINWRYTVVIDKSAVSELSDTKIQNESVYDLNGRQIKEPLSGVVYIRSGKKYVSK